MTDARLFVDGEEVPIEPNGLLFSAGQPDDVPTEWQESERMTAPPEPVYPASPTVLMCPHGVPLHTDPSCHSCAAARRREVMSEGQREVEDLVDEFTRDSAAGDSLGFFTRLVAQRMRWRTWEKERRELEDEIAGLRRVVRELNRTYRPVSKDVGDLVPDPRDFSDPATTFPVE